MQKSIGTIYGVLLNDPVSMTRLAGQFSEDPYKAPPRAPILYIKPANTIAAGGSVVQIPASPGRVQIGATIAAVIGRTATRISPDRALDYVSGFRIAADVSLPHDSFYRPAIRERCRDGFCPLGDLSQSAGFDANSAIISLSVNGRDVQQRTLVHSVRPIHQLLADITEFMTLEAGDLLLLGLADLQPVANPGDTISIAIAGLGALNFELALEHVMVPA